MPRMLTCEPDKRKAKGIYSCEVGCGWVGLEMLVDVGVGWPIKAMSPLSAAEHVLDTKL